MVAPLTIRLEGPVDGNLRQKAAACIGGMRFRQIHCEFRLTGLRTRLDRIGLVFVDRVEGECGSGKGSGQAVLCIER